MAFRQIFKSVIQRTRPIVFISSTSLFVNDAATKKPSADQKLTLEPPDVRTLSYDYMIKQTTIDAVNTASQALTVTYSAIETTSKEYRNLLTRLIVLVRETLGHDVSDFHWDTIVEIRAEVELKKHVVLQLVGFMDYVHKLAVAASETTYLAGMDNLSTTLCQRIDDALQKVQEEVDRNRELEEEYCRIQEQCIVKSTKEAVSQDQKEELVIAQIPEINLDNLDDIVDPVS